MKIKRNGMEVELTTQELREAFLEQQRLYQLEDAKMHLEDYLDLPENEAVMLLHCRAKYGVEYPDLFDESSNNYILDQIVEDYNSRCDCNIPENDTYDDVIDRLMKQWQEDNENNGYIALANDSFLPRMELWKNEEYYVEFDEDNQADDYINLYIPITFDICEALNIPDIDDDLISMYVGYFSTSKKIDMIICYQTLFDDYSFEIQLSEEQQKVAIKTLNEESKKAYGYDLDSLVEHEKEEAEKDKVD